MSEENLTQESGEKIVEKSGGLKIQDMMIIAAATLFVSLFLNWVIDRKIEQMRNEVRNEIRREIITEVSKAFVERDKVANNNAALASKNVNDVWKWLKKNVEVQNKITRNFDSKIIELRKDLNENVDVGNKNNEVNEKELDDIWDQFKKLEDDMSELSELRQGLDHTADNAVENSVKIFKLQRSLDAQMEYVDWLQRKYFGIFRMP